MSGFNVSYNMSKAIGNEMGEVTFEGKVTNRSSESAKSIVGGVINEILDNAVDIALATNVRKTLLEGQHPHDIYVNPYDITLNCPAIREIIDGLSSIHTPTIKTKAEEPLPLDIEMKRLLTEMMSPPYEIVNYETVPRKDGVGDQSTDLAAETIDLIDSQEKMQCPSQRIVEKKSRVTDLVMNSKKILTNLLYDEAKKNQEEWETKEEEEIRVIELEEHPSNTKIMESQVDENDSTLDIDISAAAFRKEANLVDTVSMTDVGEGDKIDCSNNIEEAASAKDIQDAALIKNKEKKKKKWAFMLRFLGIKKKVQLEQSNNVPSAISNP